MRAFSLIELIVVIAIVGLLSAIAVPAYSLYSTRAKISSAFPALSSVESKMKVYFDTKGVFPTLTQLGFTQGAQPGVIADATVISPALSQFAILPSNSGTFSCTASNGSTYSMGATAISAGYGLDNGNNYLYNQYIFFNPSNNHTYSTLCIEQLYDSGFTLVPDFSGYMGCTMPDGTPVTMAKISSYTLSCGTSW